VNLVWKSTAMYSLSLLITELISSGHAHEKLLNKQTPAKYTCRELIQPGYICDCLKYISCWTMLLVLTKLV